MSHLQYFNYKGYGEESVKTTHYSQATRVGDRIEMSGQPGFDRITAKVAEDIEEEIDLSFANVAHTVEIAGGSMKQVYKLLCYVVDLDDERLQLVVAALRKWFPDHQPLITLIGVSKLGLPGMRVETEGTAYLGK